MAVNQVRELVEKARCIQAEHDQFSTRRTQNIRELETSCRRSEEGHIWQKIAREPQYGNYTYLNICVVCGFYCNVSGNSDINVIRQVLSAEVVLSPQKEEIRKRVIKEYSEETQNKLDSLNRQLAELRNEINEIREMCCSFLGISNGKGVLEDNGYWD